MNRHLHRTFQAAVAPFAPDDGDDDIRAEEVELEAFDIPDVERDDSPSDRDCDLAARAWFGNRLGGPRE